MLRSFSRSPRQEMKPRNWRSHLDQTYSILEGIWNCRSADEICRCLLKHCGRFGATHILAGAIPPPRASRRKQLSHVLLTAWPEEWSQRYFSRGYLDQDPTIRLVSRGSQPFLWSEVGETLNIGPSGRRVMDEATEFRLHEGLTVSFATVERQAVGFSIAGERLEIGSGEYVSLQFVAAFALGRALALVDGILNREPVRLSPRQRDVLHWASEGLSVDSIALRLNISRNTVDTHLRAVRERLGVASTVHAVAEAFRLRIIR
ncbi:helix-turn-helix transcriptional regulator [Mesorhizobium sp. NZP2298]|uniref:helix-turn-helix transcriptional regulator n=1 Tax=Mesorhizobium sp. NZP2298 TaxID=2483403 RepID=UPI0015553F00|nr:LuxR family transcriptional regulator [Mesorhizobium sp. NZP2298]